MTTRQRYLWSALTTVLVLAGVGAPLLLRADEPVEAAPAARPLSFVEAERQYYVLLSVLEVEPKNGDDGWDIDGSPPDLYYEVFWKGHRVFKSSTKSDTLVAKWSNVSIGLGDLVKAVSLDESIKAARITAREADAIEFRVYDADIASDDLVGRWTIPVKDLLVGTFVSKVPAGRIVSAACRVLPMDDVKFESLTR